MILTCPDCATKYEVDGALIPVAGREVRCSGCQTVWHTGHSTASPYKPQSGSNVSHLDMVAQNMSSDRTPGRDYSFTSGAYFSRPSSRGGAGLAGATALKADFEMEDVVDAVHYGAEQNFDLCKEDIDDAMFEDVLADLHDAPLKEEASAPIVEFEKVDSSRDWTAIREMFSTQLHQQEMSQSEGSGAVSPEFLEDRDGIENVNPTIKKNDDEALESTPSSSIAAQVASPFHAELDALQSVLLKAGLTIAPVTDVEATSDQVDEIDANLAPYQNDGDVITVEGDVTKDQLIRQYKETKKSASHFAKTSRRLMRLFWRYTPPVFKNTSNANGTLSMQDVRLLESPHVKSFRRQARLKVKNKMTPLKAVGWLSWGAAAVSVIFSIITYKEQIIEKIPGSATFYYLAGFAKPTSPLELDSIVHRYAMSTQGAVVEISGAVRNTSAHTILAPQVEARALGRNGMVLETWIIDVPVSKISPQMETTFLARAKAPEGIEQVKLRAVESENGARGLIHFQAPGSDEDFFIQSTIGGIWSAPKPIQPDSEGLPITE